MRILALTISMLLLLAGSAIARDRDRYELDEEWWYTPIYEGYSPLVTPGFGHSNDRGGFRTFIPRDQQFPPQYYGNPGYSRDVRIGRGDHFQRGYRRHRHEYDHSYRGYNYGYRRGGYTVIPYAQSYYGNPFYGAPTYIYPNNSAIVIDGSPLSVYPPSAPLPPQYREENYYDNRVYDNSQTTTNNYYPPPAPAASLPEQPAPVGPQQGAPRAEGPQSVNLRVERPFGTRFFDQARLETPEAAWVLVVEEGVLYASKDGAKRVKVTEVSNGFGGFALYQPASGVAVIIQRASGEIAVAYPAEKGKWYVENLPYSVDPTTEPSIGMIRGEPWVTITAVDGTRYVMALRERRWHEIGSGTTR